jgi:hypothetical protein
MPAAIRSVFSASVALAGAGVIAVSPITPVTDIKLPTLQAPAIELVDFSVPALGAIPYQILVNQIANVVALAPILFGGTEQCVTCLGPTAPPSPAALPFTGWGVLGIATGLLTSPFALVETLSDTSNLAQALGVAGLAIQTPITNTLALLEANRELFGGFELQAVLDRAFIAIKHTVDYTVNIAAQALVSGPITIIEGVVIGLQAFVGTLAATGDLAEAFSAGRVPINTAVTESLAALSAETQEARATIYADLTAGPTTVKSPIPTVPPPPAAVVAEQPQPAAAGVADIAAVDVDVDVDVEKESTDAGAAERINSEVAPKPAATSTTGPAVSQAARDGVTRARTAGTQVGSAIKDAVKDAVGGPKRVRSAATR